MNCPKCSCSSKTKSGFTQSRQRYKCKSCGYHFSVTLKSTAKPIYLKRLALQLYLEGLGFRSIARVLGVSNVSVLNWIRSFGKEVTSLRRQQGMTDFIELDEMHNYVGSKKTIDRYGLLLIDMRRDSSNSLLATEVENQLKHYENN